MKKQTNGKDFISQHPILSKLAKKSDSASTRNKTSEDRLVYVTKQSIRKAFSNTYNSIGFFLLCTYSYIH